MAFLHQGPADPAQLQAHQAGAHRLGARDEFRAQRALGDQHGPRVRQQRAHLAQRLVVEGQHVHPVQRVALAQHLGQDTGGGDVLDLGLDRLVHRVQNLLEDRHPLAETGVQAAQLVEGEVGDGAAAVGGPVDLVVVHDDQRAVLAQVQVELDLVQSLALRAGEGAKRVLGLDTHDTAMTDCEKPQGAAASCAT